MAATFPPPDYLVSELYQQRVSLKYSCEPAQTIVAEVSQVTRTWVSYHRG